MKQLILIISTLLFVACSKPDIEEPVAQLEVCPLIVAKWINSGSDRSYFIELRDYGLSANDFTTRVIEVSEETYKKHPNGVRYCKE